MNVLRTPIIVAKTVQTLMALLSVPVEMGSVFAVMGGAVKVHVMHGYQQASYPMVF